MVDKVLITGATGTVGFELIRALWRRNVPIRAATRDVASRPSLTSANIEWIAFDFTQPDTFAEAMAGVSKLFLLRPPNLTDVERLLFPFIDHAVASGVQQIVFLSQLDTQHNAASPHFKVEMHIKRTLVPYTFLRANLFMQNLLTFYQEDICRNYQIFIPAGVGRVSFVDARDVAEAAAVTLVGRGHQHRAYDLTGSEALTFATIAATLADVLNVPFSYVQPSPRRYAEQRRIDGLPEVAIEMRQRRYCPIRLGMHARLADDIEQILGHPPTTFRRFALDHADVWCKDRD